jgi:hypothetical protein
MGNFEKKTTVPQQIVDAWRAAQTMNEMYREKCDEVRRLQEKIRRMEKEG